ncbi:hypothetical protein HS041_28550 [Planomonospora sp. ID67723]|uniref:hypothetical protein n=1 Tax=Planomonospora sp. ID67723 TaxID=2738134 RepID=UPI0018C38579|nr:hypothetical protein [Planomonospora sp. ID67723]MBG0826601.1 hypothetical protein [Planomonospora sp. ID67723]MBG0831682.1 hypothetical protein [Planomonospora sp. ID67723]
MSIDLHGRITRWRQTGADRRAANTAANLDRQPAFPGRWVSAASLIAGPTLIMIGTLLRSSFYYFVPYQLVAYTQHPTLITAAYACFAFGFVLLLPGVVALAQRITATSPLWGLWGGCLVIVGLFTRTFQFGTDHLAFHLTDTLGLQTMLTGIDGYYDAWRETVWHPFRSMSGPAFFGWVVLAIGAYRSGALGLGRSIALGLMSALALGTLKGTEPQSFIAVGGLCLAFIPLGISLLRSGPPPTRRAMIWIAVLIAIHVLMTGFGPRG